MAAEIRTEPELEVAIPEPLFECVYTFGGGIDHYSVADDGRFLMLKDEIAHAWPPTVNVVLNWSEKLKQRVPTGRSR